MNRALIATAALALSLSACGGDDPPAAASRPAGNRPHPAAPQAAAAATGTPLSPYEKIPDALRAKLTLRDFQPDPTGDTKRDPFRGYVVVGHMSVGQGGAESSPPRCSDKATVADSYAIRDLTLIGIILRGTKSYAMFRDTAGLGHTAHRGECLGKERAVITKIGAGFVRLEQPAETSSSGTPLPAQEREILLHPEEYELPTEMGTE